MMQNSWQKLMCECISTDIMPSSMWLTENDHKTLVLCALKCSPLSLMKHVCRWLLIYTRPNLTLKELWETSQSMQTVLHVLAYFSIIIIIISTL